MHFFKFNKWSPIGHNLFVLDNIFWFQKIINLIEISLLLTIYFFKLSFTSHYSKIYLFNFEVGYPTPKFIDNAENYLNLVNFEYEKPSIESDIFLLEKCLEKNKSISDKKKTWFK